MRKNKRNGGYECSSLHVGLILKVVSLEVFIYMVFSPLEDKFIIHVASMFSLRMKMRAKPLGMST